MGAWPVTECSEYFFKLFCSRDGRLLLAGDHLGTVSVLDPAAAGSSGHSEEAKEPPRLPVQATLPLNTPDFKVRPFPGSPPHVYRLVVALFTLKKKTTRCF